MKYFPLVVVLFSICLMPAAASAAKLQADVIDSNDREARYLVSWEAGMWTSGTIYASMNRANKKVVKKSEEFCAARGYNRWRFATLAEIANDETLKTAWEIATGGTGKSHSTERNFNLFSGVEVHNRVRRILVLNKVDGGRGPCREAVGEPAGRSLAGGVAADGAAAARPAVVDSRRAAAEQGDTAAQNELGEMYFSGTGVDKDPRQAANWFLMAAEQGHAPAQLNLGLAYADGLGVPNDHVRAHLWLNLAATSGDDRARDERDRLTRKMTPEQIAEAQRLAHEWWQTHDP